MNNEIKTENTYQQTELAIHRKRCIATMIHEQTRAGKPTTVRDVAMMYGWNVNRVNSLIRLCMAEPVETSYGMVLVVKSGQKTSPAGVSARTYAAILHHEKTAQ